MRKHLLRILTVLLIACFGACLFAACGGEGTGTGNGGDETTYTLTYDANGGTGTVAAETHKEGDKVTLKGADAFTNEGYTFKEWSDGSKTYSAGASFTMPAKNVTMKAQWEPTGSTPATYTLTFTGDKDNVDIEIEGGAKEAYEENSKVRFSATAS